MCSRNHCSELWQSLLAFYLFGYLQQERGSLKGLDHLHIFSMLKQHLSSFKKYVFL